MAKLLYITCNLLPVQHSCSQSLGAEFLDEYLRWNPRDEVYCLDLYRDNIQHVDVDVLNAWEKLADGGRLALLNGEEQRKIGRMLRLAEQFVGSDKYVFVTHSLNLFFPAEFKTYVDAICAVNKINRITDPLAQGVPREQRKSLHLHSLGAICYGKEEDLSGSYLRSVLNSLGVEKQLTVQMEGSDDPRRQDPDRLSRWRRECLALAAQF